MRTRVYDMCSHPPSFIFQFKWKEKSYWYEIKLNSFVTIKDEFIVFTTIEATKLIYYVHMHIFDRRDATMPPACDSEAFGRLINHRRKRGRNLKPIVFEVDQEPRIFFMVDVEKIPKGKQICYDYQDTTSYDPAANLVWLKETNESSDDEGKW